MPYWRIRRFMTTLTKLKYIDLGLDGIEVWHPSATEDDVHRLTEICKAHDLLMTGGSDFHGIYGAKTVTLGTCTTPQEWVDKLLGYKAKKKRAQRRAEKKLPPVPLPKRKNKNMHRIHNGPITCRSVLFVSLLIPG